MDSFPRNTPALMARIDQLRNSLLKRFENLIELAAPDKTDRNTTALTVYQQQIETAALIRTTEDITTLIRQMMEAWKFGHLKTIDQSSDLQTRTDEDAKEVWGMLTQLMGSSPADAPADANGEIAMADGRRDEA